MCTKTQLKKISDEVSSGVYNVLGKKLHSIILFGSYARGDFNDDSDVDIAVLADIKDEVKFKRAEREIDLISSDVSLENDVTVCILLYNKHFFDSHLHISPFYRNVKNEGVVLYAN